MNDLLERYLGAVCVYFFGKKRNRVYNDLKNNILPMVSSYDDMEDVLVKFGHPRSIALSYGYRPIINHIYNKDIVNKVEKYLYIFTGVYLILSTLFYLYEFNCLPFFPHDVSIMNSSLIYILLNRPFFVLIAIFVINILYLIKADRIYPTEQKINLRWTIDDLYQLPHPSQYPKRIVETYLMIGFIIFFVVYGLIFSLPMINTIQHESYQMIHLMRDFFQPFIVIVIFDYIVDLTKNIYSKKYLIGSTLINLFIFISLTVFIVNSSFLNDYLLPLELNFKYILINMLILIALFYIYLIAFIKLLRNIKYYKSLYEK